MTFEKQLSSIANNSGNILCLGLDPVLERIPIDHGTNSFRIRRFCVEILRTLQEEDCAPAAVKPNYAYFAQYGTEGLRALKEVITRAKTLNMPVVLDAKRGDIGPSSAAYARECFDVWHADAVTLHPYMGFDSVAPFVAKRNQAAYVLVRTSNPSAKELQGMPLRSGRLLYEETAQRVALWRKKAKGTLGAVVGATAPKELERLASLFSRADKRTPLLIPGVGAQGGSAKTVMRILDKSGLALPFQRVNVSSGILYAWEKKKTNDFAGAALKQAKEFEKELKL